MRRLTDREWNATLMALSRALAGEPETEDEDVVAMGTAHEKIAERQRDRVVDTPYHVLTEADIQKIVDESKQGYTLDAR